MEIWFKQKTGLEWIMNGLRALNYEWIENII